MYRNSIYFFYVRFEYLYQFVIILQNQLIFFNPVLISYWWKKIVLKQFFFPFLFITRVEIRGKLLFIGEEIKKLLVSKFNSAIRCGCLSTFINYNSLFLLHEYKSIYFKLIFLNRTSHCCLHPVFSGMLAGWGDYNSQDQITCWRVLTYTTSLSLRTRVSILMQVVVCERSKKCWCRKLVHFCIVYICLHRIIATKIIGLPGLQTDALRDEM